MSNSKDQVMANKIENNIFLNQNMIIFNNDDNDDDFFKRLPNILEVDEKLLNPSH